MFMEGRKKRDAPTGKYARGHHFLTMKKIFFYFALLILIYLATFWVNLPDFDLWARLAVGSIFFQTGSVLKQDIFSYLPTKNLWIDHEWGSGVVFYGFAKLMGDWGIFAVKALALLIIFLCIVKIIELRTKRPPGIFYMMFVCFALLPGIGGLVRCQIFTYLFFTTWLYFLERIKRNENKFIWIFPASMLFWTNLHGGFLAGVGLIVIYAVGELLNRRNSLKYFGILALILPVTLINPYGLDLWKFILNAAFMPRPYITEWDPVTWDGPYHLFQGMKIHILSGFFIFACLTVSIAIKKFRESTRPDWTKIFMIIVFLYMGIRHQRHTQFFTLAASALFYDDFVELWNPLQEWIDVRLKNISRRLWTAFKYGFGYLLLAAVAIFSLPALSHRIAVAPQVYPVGSFEFIRQNHLTGNLATTFVWGSYALWKLYPQCRVMIDGRYEEVYPQDIYLMAMQLSEHTINWREILIKYPPDILVLPKNRYTPADLAALSDWQIVYTDIVSVVLLPKDRVSALYSYPDSATLFNWKEDLSKKIVF